MMEARSVLKHLGAAALMGLAAISAARAQDAASLVPQDLRSRGTLTVGSQQTFPPVEFKKPDETKVTGVSADLLAEIAKRLGLQLEYIHGEYASLIPGLEAKRFDMASGGISDTVEREQAVDFVNYMMSGGSIRRVSSPPSAFSTLITSAPMSASMRAEVGPAITWARSMTRIPLSGPRR